jgi:archaemetzincin
MDEGVMFDDSGFQKMTDPKPGEWLFHFHEPGQSFDEYVASRPIRTAGKRQVLVFQPVGPFSPVEQDIINEALRFAGIWFDLSTRTEPAVALPKKGWHRMERLPWRDEPVKQYQTAYFLNRFLPKRLPKDADCFLAITMADLYPGDNWKFVFGQASLSERIGVFSMARYFPAFWGKEDSEASNILALRRTCKVLAHEVGHVFGMAHCIHYQCAMNGSNSLEESDGRPLRLCPVCLKKLHWNRRFQIKERYEKLKDFFARHGLKDEAQWLSKILKGLDKKD